MSIDIVEADIEKNLDDFLSLLNRNRLSAVGRDRFDWLYLKNPAGRARAWMVMDAGSEAPVAFTCVLPRIVGVDGEKVICWNCGDFSVDKKFRTLGVALKLRRKAKECVDNGEIPALYAHPNDRMKLVHERVGHDCIGKMNRYVKVLKVNNQLDKKIKNRAVVRAISPVMNAMLDILDMCLLWRRAPEFEVRHYSDCRFGSEFDALYEKSLGWYKVIGDRSAGYLNWRYGTNPLYSCERLVVRHKGELVGYVIFHIAEGVAVLKDILCLPGKGIHRILMRHWVAYLRQKGVGAVSAIFMDSNPVIPRLKRSGFRIRPEESSVFAYASDDPSIRPGWMDGDGWYMTVGDRDV